IIKEVIISGPEVVYEFGDDGDSNLDKLNKAVQSKADGGGSKSSGGGDAPNIVIESLVLQNGKVAVVAPLLNDPSVQAQDVLRKVQELALEAETQSSKQKEAAADLDLELAPKGLRVLRRVNRLPDELSCRIANHFGEFARLQRATV
ncbi:MAG: hypothetical protein VW453_03225, partial [Rhodospirillaceae bacterium]